MALRGHSHCSAPQQVELLGLIEQRAVDAAQVGSLMVHIGIAGQPQRTAPREVVQYRVVLNLAQAHQHGPLFALGGGCQSARNVVQLAPVAAACPVAAGFGQKLKVVLQRIMAAVEEVLHVPPHDSLACGLAGRQQQEHEQQYGAVCHCSVSVGW